jgi:hypothetical protein
MSACPPIRTAAQTHKPFIPVASSTPVTDHPLTGEASTRTINRFRHTRNLTVDRNPMRAIFHTLPPELMTNIFESLDDVQSATRLASTCGYFNAIWLKDRSALCKKQVWGHPVLAHYRRPRHEQVPKGVTLVESAKQLERVRRSEPYPRLLRIHCDSITNAPS